MYRRHSRIQNQSIFEKLFVGVKNKIKYFGDQSNLHGVGHVCSMNRISIFKRLFWLIFLVMCCFGAASMLQKVLRFYSNDVVSYSVETDYLTWDTPFPAVTVCESKPNIDRVKGILASDGLPSGLASFFKDVYIWLEKFCKCDYKPSEVNKKYVDYFQEYTTRIRYNCSQMLTDCWWDGQEFPCCESVRYFDGVATVMITERLVMVTLYIVRRFLPLQTEIGVCYSFNSQLTVPELEVLTLNRQSSSLPDLVFTALNPQYNSVKIHASDETLSAPTMDDVLGRANSLLKPAGLSPPIDIHISLKVEEQTVSDMSVSTLPPFLRGCLYKYERPAFAHLWPFKIYSLQSCVLYCRAIWQVDRCNCTHHLMPKLEGVAACDISGMRCLNANWAEMLSVALNCDCPLACEDTVYKLVNLFKEENKKVLKGASRVRVSLASRLSMRVRRQALRNMLSLVVDIGGLGGVFFGASLLSVIEIIYLFFIRRGS